MSKKDRPDQSGTAEFSLGPRQPDGTVLRTIGPRQPSNPGGSVGPRQPQAPAAPPPPVKKK